MNIAKLILTMLIVFSIGSYVCPVCAIITWPTLYWFIGTTVIVAIGNNVNKDK